MKMCERTSTDYLCCFKCSLKSLARRLKLSTKCLWSDVKCLWSDTKVANIKPMVKTAPTLNIKRETIIFSADQEPKNSSFMIWYVIKMPRSTKRITNIFSRYSTTLFSFFILTTNLFHYQPHNKDNEYYKHYSKQPIKICSLYHMLTKKVLKYKSFSHFNSEFFRNLTP